MYDWQVFREIFLTVTFIASVIAYPMPPAVQATEPRKLNVLAVEFTATYRKMLPKSESV